MNRAKKELTNLVDKLKKEIFYGVEDPKIHYPTKIEFEYSLGKFVILNEHPNLPNKSFIELCFSKNYKVTSFKEKNAHTGKTKDLSKSEIEDLKRYGMLSNYLKRDPRYVIKNSKDFKEISPGVYSMIIWDEGAKELNSMSKETDGLMADVIQYTEIYVHDKDLKRMIVKTRFMKKSGTSEKVFTDISFYK